MACRIPGRGSRGSTMLRPHAIAASVRARRITYLSHRALVDLYRAARHLNVPGDVIEAGTALGGSAAVLAAAMPPGRTLHLYDTFGMIPPPSDADGPDVHARYATIAAGKSRGVLGGVYYGYRGDLREHVEAVVRRYARNVEIALHSGLYEDTFVPTRPIALAHLDCDWYASVRICLERVWPVLSPGGRVVIDDYDDWSGARRAVDEFIACHDVILERHARPHLVKARRRRGA